MRNKNMSPAFLYLTGYFLLCIATSLSGQKPNLDRLIINPDSVGEKVYLHIDRPNYMQGDTIWFKAYTWYGYEQEPDTMSRVLYVDLISVEGNIISTKKIALEYGTTWGEIILDKKIKPGEYLLRAYTRWMQYAKNGNPFYQTIKIDAVNQDLMIDYTPVILKAEGTGTDSLQIGFTLSEMGQTGELIKTNNHEVDWSINVSNKLERNGSLKVKNSTKKVLMIGLDGINTNDTLAVLNLAVHSGDSVITREFNIPLLDLINLQFFPEGGTMVTGLENRIAFKAIGRDGLSRDVVGKIVDENEVIIANFESIHKGMGSFLLKPESQKKYFAVLTFNDRLFRIPIPNADEKGLIMTLSLHGDGITPSLTLRYSATDENTHKYIIASSYGKVQFAASLVTPKDSCKIELPADRFQEGVIRLTVLNSDFEPECERIFYVNKKQRFKIDVIPDSVSYTSRSKVSLLIKTTNRIDGSPLRTELSIAVSDKELAGNYENLTGISTYKLIQSELKGNIEDPDYYFRGNGDFEALDLLMLTQGYRTFAKPADTTDPDLLLPEREYKISGKLELPDNKQKNNDFDFNELDLMLLIISEQTIASRFKPDSLGFFTVLSPIPYGKASALLKVVNSKEKPFKGNLLLNDLDPPVKFAPISKPVTISSSPVVTYTKQLIEIKKTQMSKDLMKGSRIIDLPEIVVTARSKNWFLDFEKNAEKIVDMDLIDPTGKSFESIYDVLVRDFGAIWYTFEYQHTKTVLLPISCVVCPKYWLPIYVVNGGVWFDGTDIDYLSRISYFQVNEIKKLMVLPPGEISDYYAHMDYRKIGVKQSLIVIETYPNLSYRGDPVGIKNFIINGLDRPREFYSPKYEGTLKDNSIYDSRTTLFWDPFVETDINGEAKVEFYTSDRNTTFQVIINGIEVNSGQPGQGSILIKSD